MRITQTLKRFASVIRWNDYGPEKTPQLLCICMYIAVVKPIYTVTFVYDTLVFMVFAIVSSVYGYLVNDCGDSDIDQRQGKPNAFSSVGRFRASCIVAGILALDAALALRFVSRPCFLHLWLAWVLMSTFYSLPPIRFKERGVAGLIIPAVAQQTLPVIIVFSVYDYFVPMDMIVLASFPTIKGISLILRHQLNDVEKDLSTDTRTFTATVGAKPVQVLYSWALRLEVLSVVGVLALLFTKVPALRVGDSTWWVWGLAVLSAVLALAVAGVFPQYIGRIIADPYARGGVLSFIHITFPTFVLPAFLVLILAVNYPPYTILLAFMLLMNYRYTFQIRERWLFRVLATRFRRRQ